MPHSFPQLRSSDLRKLCRPAACNGCNAALQHRRSCRAKGRTTSAASRRSCVSLTWPEPGGGRRVRKIEAPRHTNARHYFRVEASRRGERSEEQTSELQSLMRITYDVF